MRINARQAAAAPLPYEDGVAGIDEAGRGPLAGPVAVAAVLLDPARPIAGLDDSKKIAAPRRRLLFEAILANARSVALVLVPPAEIDAKNIRAATLAGMRRAAEALAVKPLAFVVDGRDVPHSMPAPATALIGGDGRNAAIAAASIIAKVARDELMCRLASDFPGYGFERHMGYGTAFHLSALARLGPSPAHRLSFAPVASAARSAIPR